MQELYKQNAKSLQQEIQRAGGVHRAADIIEQVAVSQGKPITSKLNFLLK